MPVPVIQALKVERTPNANGGFDVTVHMPVLELVNKVGIVKAREITGLPIAGISSPPS